MRPLVDPDFWRDRAVLLTGHTGFKGAWLALWLQSLGARVSGLSDGVPTVPSLYELARVGDGVQGFRADVRDHEAVLAAFAAGAPEIVIHMAAQPFVRRSFVDPRGTYETNVMGTVNVLEAVRHTPSVRVVVAVTSDKCYDNDASRAPRPFVEGDSMGGHDPYSSSKGCAELVV
ncbi:MAG: GDP-mannose 4,6-dehydratase, partial [Solirubrobacteraceae bacterium]